jgi:hypothetical protein
MARPHKDSGLAMEATTKLNDAAIAELAAQAADAGRTSLSMALNNLTSSEVDVHVRYQVKETSRQVQTFDIFGLQRVPGNGYWQPPTTGILVTQQWQVGFCVLQVRF